jgi:hypothetical protein
MRKYNNYVIHNDIRVEPGTLNGTVYWDHNNNDLFDVQEGELPIEDVTMALYDPIRRDDPNKNVSKQYTYTAQTNEYGFYEFEGIIPGTYKLEVRMAGHNLTRPDDVLFQVNEPKTMDIGIKPGGIKGVVNYFNESVAANITLELYDETNEKTTTLLSLPNGTFSFNDLLPGNYSLVVATPGYKRVEMRVLIEEAATNETNVVLIPITPVSGLVINDLDNDKQLDSNEMLPNARITFYNHEHSELTTVMYANDRSEFFGNLSAGNYTAYVRYHDNTSVYANMLKLQIFSQEETQTGLDIMVEDATEVSGILTKLFNRTVPGALINITKQSDGSVLPVPTNYTGFYVTYLPPGEYTLSLHHVDLGTTYAYVKDFTLVNNPFELNFNVNWSTQVNGTIFWDRDGNGEFTSYSFDRLPSFEDVIPGTRGSRQDEAVDGVVTTSGLDNETLFKESMEGVTLGFTDINGTIYTTSNVTGFYIINLPPGDFKISIEDQRFRDLSESMPDSLLNLIINDTITHSPILKRDFELLPRPVDVSGIVWYDKNSDGVFDSNESISDIPIVLTNLSLGADRYEITSDENGRYSLSVLPGLYQIEIDKLLPDGIRYTYFEDIFEVPFKTDDEDMVKNISLNKFIKVNYTVELLGEPLLKNELTSQNLTLHIYDSDKNEIEPIPAEDVDLGGYIVPGVYDLWLEYYSTGNNYVFLGTHNIDPTTRDFNLPLVKGLRVNGTVYNDTGEFGTIDISDWLNDIQISFKPDNEEGGLILLNNKTGIYSVYVIPDTDYTVEINSTKNENVNGKNIGVNYFYKDEISVEEDTSYDIETVRFINISGLLFYNIFETDLALSGQEDPQSGEVLVGGDLGKVVEGAEIIFTELSEVAHPEMFTTTSDAEGNFYVFLKDRLKYNIEIQRRGFHPIPTVVKSFEVADNNATMNLQADPTYVTVSGRIYSSEDNSTITDIEHLEFTLYHEDIGTIYKIEDVKDGYYSIELLPEEYMIYGYTEPEIVELNETHKVRRSSSYFDAVNLEIGEDKVQDLAMEPGVLTWGYANYYNSNEELVTDVNQYNADGKGLVIESSRSNGTKTLDIEGGYFEIYLPEGVYRVNSDFEQTENDMDIMYRLSETLSVTNETGRTTFEFNKVDDFGFDFTLEGDENEVTVPAGSEKEFTFKLVNRGNSRNTISLLTSSFPDGWIIKFMVPSEDEPGTDVESDSITLDINEEKTISAVVKIVAGAYHDNEIVFTATSEGDGTTTQTESIKMYIPAQYKYDFYTDSPKEIGITHNETIELFLTIQNLGNAQDTITIVGPDIADAWNVTIDGNSLDSLENFVYDQNIDYKNLTLKIKAPDLDSGYMLDQKLNLNFIAHSENGNKSIGLNLVAKLDMPDLKVTSFDIDNLELTEPDRDNITINATVTSLNTGVKDVKVSLIIDGEPVANATIAEIPQNGVKFVQLSYEDAGSDKGEHTIQVYVDPDSTIQERNEFNNDQSSIVNIGKVKETPEFNWRPYAFIIGLVIFLVILGIYWRWRRKV